MTRQKFSDRFLLRAIRPDDHLDGCLSGRCCVYSRMGPHGLWYCSHPAADRHAVVVSLDHGLDHVCSEFVPLGREGGAQ